MKIKANKVAPALHIGQASTQGTMASGGNSMQMTSSLDVESPTVFVQHSRPYAWKWAHVILSVITTFLCPVSMSEDDYSKN